MPWKVWNTRATRRLTLPVSNNADTDAPIVVVWCVSSHVVPASSFIDSSVSPRQETVINKLLDFVCNTLKCQSNRSDFYGSASVEISQIHRKEFTNFLTSYAWFTLSARLSKRESEIGTVAPPRRSSLSVPLRVGLTVALSHNDFKP